MPLPRNFRKRKRLVVRGLYPLVRPVRHLPGAPLRPDPAAWTGTGIHAAWLGHSTVLLQMDGFNILTDPIFSVKAGIHLGPIALGVARQVRPALEIPALPHIDLILLSHAHMDHFDLPSLRALEDSGTEVVTAWSTADLLHVNRYARVTELRWGQSVQVGPAAIRAFEVKHWGARYQSDTYRGYNAYAIECGRYRVIFGGDTALTDSFRRNRVAGGVHLAILPIGAYNPWIWVHANPEQAWSMAQDAGAEYVLPVHHQTFALGREPRLEPIERVLAAAKSAEQRVVIREIGGDFHLS
jgi:L-ascorbate metabolism protein UlaG (beta-lactamase superfamily)